MCGDIFYALIISLAFFVPFISALVGLKLKIGKSDKCIQMLTFGMVSMMLLYSILDHLQRSTLVSYYFSSFIFTFLLFLATHNIYYKHRVDQPPNSNQIENGFVIEECSYFTKPSSLGFLLYFHLFSTFSLFKGLSLFTFESGYVLTALLSITIYRTVESLLVGFKIYTSPKSSTCEYLFLITVYSLYASFGMINGYFNWILTMGILRSNIITNIVDGSFFGCLSFIFIDSFHHLFSKSNFVNRNGKYAFSKLVKAFFTVFFGIVIGSCVFLTYGIDLELRDHSYVLKNNTNLGNTPVLNINSTTSFEHVYDTMSKVVSKIMKLNFF